jgi:hypothetical protein
MSATSRHCLFVCLVVLGSGRVALAQDHHLIEVAAGYQFIDPTGSDPYRYPDTVRYTSGLFAGIAWNATSRLAVVGEFGRSAKTIPVSAETLNVFGPTSQTLYTNAAGVRYWLGRVFVQGLFGQGALAAQKEQLQGTLDRTTTGTLVQPGVGVNLAVSDRIAGRILGDFQYLVSDNGPFKRQFRIGGGVAVGIGPRR